MHQADDPALAQALDHWGPRWQNDIHRARDAMVAMYGERLRLAGVRQQQVARELRYGDDPRQVLDVFASPHLRAAPVLLFVHGGAFVRGEREISPFIHANVAAEFAAHGYLAVNAGYRLAPAAPWPQGAADVRAALAWVRAHAEDYGGDPRRVVLMGHSAGCAHCATAVWSDDDPGSATAILPDALVLISPRVRIDLDDTNPNRAGVLAYYGDDLRMHAGRAPVDRADARIPTLLVSAGFENPGLDRDMAELRQRLGLAGDTTTPDGRMAHLHLPQHNHMSIAAQFHTGTCDLGAKIRRWYEATRMPGLEVGP